MIALVPSTLLLLPEYAGQVDPVPDLRQAVGDAVATLGEQPVRVVTADARPDNLARGVTDPAGLRIARHLLGDRLSEEGEAVLVVANGSACRTEKAPGHLDERAAGFDETIEKALRGGPVDEALALSPQLAQELWCHDLTALQWLVGAIRDASGGLTHADTSHGVQWWVGSWGRA